MRRIIRYRKNFIIYEILVVNYQEMITTPGPPPVTAFALRPGEPGSEIKPIEEESPAY